MKIEWKDKSSWAQSDTAEKRKVPTTWEACCGDVRVVVHHHVGCGATWFVTCHALGIKAVELSGSDPDMAKAQALRAVDDEARSIFSGVTKIVSELSS